MKWCILVLFVEFVYSQEIYESVEAIAGNMATIPCVVEPSNPDARLNFVAWYRNDSKPGTPAIYSQDFRPLDDKPNVVHMRRPVSDRYRLNIGDTYRLLIYNVLARDAGVYYCIADFAGSSARKTYVLLHVIEPPERLWVVHENGTRVATATTTTPVNQVLGPFYVGDIVHLFCVAFGGKPQPSITWLKGNSVFKNSGTPLSDRRIRIDMEHGPLKSTDHGLVLTCSAQNNNVSKPLTVDITLDLYLPPELVTVRAINNFNGSQSGGAGFGAVKAGDEIRVQCRVLGARPQPDIIWMLNDNKLFNLEQNVTERSQRLVVSEIRLLMVREYDESYISCCANAHYRNETYICAEKLPLIVNYAPVLELNVKGNVDNGTLKVVRGSHIELNCNVSANPTIYDFIWYHGDNIINSSTTEGSLHIDNISENDAGEYVCAGSNNEGATTSEPLILDVTYPPFCSNGTVFEYGVVENEPLNLTCLITSNPEPSEYRWMIVSGVYNISTMSKEQNCTLLKSTDNLLEFSRPADMNFVTVFCWALNGVGEEETRPHYPCTFLLTHETAPRPPEDCVATKNALRDITINCIKGHNGGLPQKFILTVTSLDTNSELLSIINLEPQFIIQEPTQNSYKIVINALNEKGASDFVIIKHDDIQEDFKEDIIVSAVSDITTLALSLCGGVALLALAACGLVLCARERNDRPLTLSAYHTDESNCGTSHASDDGSECNLRRTDSFKRAVTSPKTLPKGYNVRRSSSFHSTRFLNDLDNHDPVKYTDVIGHSPTCRVHSLQNINKRRDMETACDHLMMQIPSDMPNYNVPRATSFYTMPRKMRQKLMKDNNDEISEINQSDRFSLPPPPDEFTTYRPGSRLSAKEALKQPYTSQKKEVADNDPRNPFNEVIISPMNTVGLPTTRDGLYTYADDGTQASRGGSILTTFQSSYSSPKESGL